MYNSKFSKAENTSGGIIKESALMKSRKDITKRLAKVNEKIKTESKKFGATLELKTLFEDRNKEIRMLEVIDRWIVEKRG